MRKICTFVFFLIASYMGYAQSIQSVNPIEARRNEYFSFGLKGLNTHFMASLSLTISLKSAVDGSVIIIDSVGAWSDEGCYAPGYIPLTATPGKYAVSIITTNEGTITKADAFTVSSIPMPELISVTPAVAHNGEHVRLTIQARNAGFLTTSQFSVIFFGKGTQLRADSVVALNDSTLTATLDIPGKKGSAICGLVVHSDGTMYLDSCFKIDGFDPGITAVTPNSANPGEHVDLTIQTTETNSGIISVLLQSSWADVYAKTITKINDTVLIASFDIPEVIRKSYFDVIIQGDGYIMTRWGGFKINGYNPIVTSVSPAHGEQGETVDVTITGEYLFFDSATNIDVRFYGETAGFMQGDSVVVLNKNQIKTTLKLARGTLVGKYIVDLIVDGNAYYVKDSFVVVEDGMPDPRLVSITPNETGSGRVFAAVITAERTMFTEASALEVYLEKNGLFQSKSIGVLRLGDTKLKCTFNIPSNAELGVYSVYVYDGINGSLLLLDALTITNNQTAGPKLLSVSPATTLPGQIFDVTITGSKTHFTDTSITNDVYIFSPSSQVLATSFTAANDTVMNARFEMPNDFSPGTYDLGVSSMVDGWITLLHSISVGAVGLNEEEKLTVKLYPNPVKDQLYLETETQVNTITILDITGRQIPIEQNLIEQNGNVYAISLNGLGLKKGIYFIRVTSDSGSGYHKFVFD